MANRYSRDGSSDPTRGSGRTSGARCARCGKPGAVTEIDLLAYAAISADLAEGDRPMTEILDERKLTEAHWTEATLLWNGRMAEDARDGEARVAIDFSEAFARAQDGKRALPELTPEEWSLLVEQIEGEGVAVVLAARGLRMADYARLVRHWTRRKTSVVGNIVEGV
jgi:hypothetical protein